METVLREYALPCLCAFLACEGFTLIFNIHGLGKLIAGVGGALGWLVYLLAGSTIFAAFLAAAVGAPELCKLIDGLGGAFGLVLGMTGSCALLLLVSVLSSVAAVTP